MIHNHRFINVNEALPALAWELLSNGDEFGSRAGLTKELMHVGITLDRPWQREITLPYRKASVAAQIVETMWVLAGRNDVAGLLPYLPRAADFSDDGSAWRAGYGPRLRNYQGVDQLDYLVHTMSGSPGSRQAVATIWDPTVDTELGKDIACNNWLNLSSRFGQLDLHVAIRSNDLIWGWSGINAFEWSALLEIVAGLSGLRTGALHFSTTSLHLYDRHWAKARQLSELSGGPDYLDSPRFDALACPTLARFDELADYWFRIEQMIRTGQSVTVEVNGFPEPMMRSWLRVLQWYWSGDEGFLEPLRSTRLHAAALAGVAPKGTLENPFVHAAPRPVQPSAHEETEREMDALLADVRPDFLGFVTALHAEKHAAYGDSWKRRGEYMILANIARKIDRLEGGAETSDETQADTAIDLLVYLCKYRSWLSGGSGDPAAVERDLGMIAPARVGLADAYAAELVELFEHVDGNPQRASLIDRMLPLAYTLAEHRWTAA